MQRPASDPLGRQTASAPSRTHDVVDSIARHAVRGSRRKHASLRRTDSVTSSSSFPHRSLHLSKLQSSLINPRSSWRADGGAAAVHGGPLYWPPAWQGSPDRSHKRLDRRSQNLFCLCVNQFFLKLSILLSPQIFFASSRAGLGLYLMGFCVANEAGSDPRSGVRHADQGKLSCGTTPQQGRSLQ